MVLGPLPLRLTAKACTPLHPSFRLAPQHRVLSLYLNSAKGTRKRSASLGHDVQCWEGEGHLSNCRERQCDGHQSQRPGSVVAERHRGKFLSLNFLLHKGMIALSSEMSGTNWANKIHGQARSVAQVPPALHLWVHPLRLQRTLTSQSQKERGNKKPSISIA